ncbi:MAG: metallophosphoesterase [Ruminococcus sp.]|nr:metallophosphoesterase [Ruminococcus sp.]
MKIIVISDNHGMLRNPRMILKKHPDAEIVVHCGDSQESIEDLMADFPQFRYVNVRGNCDFDAFLADYEIFTVEGVRFFVTHGHRYNVKFGLNRLMYAAEENNIQVVLFGHTHSPMNEYINGVYYINPGAVSGYRGTYALIEVKDGQVLSNIVSLDNK